MNSFKAQQARWAKGLMQTAKKILPRVMRSDVPGGEGRSRFPSDREHQLSADGSAFHDAAAGDDRALLSGLVPDAADRPAAVSGLELLDLRVLSDRAAGALPETWTRSILYLPFVMAVGIGLSVRNAKAVLEAIFGVQSEFARTPKYNIEGHSGTWKKKSYRNRAGWMPYIEVALGLYFAAAVWYAIQNQNYLTVPFLLLFVWGYLYTGLMSLGQGYFDRWRAGVGVGVRVPEAIPEEARVAATGAPGF